MLILVLVLVCPVLVNISDCRIEESSRGTTILIAGASLTESYYDESVVVRTTAVLDRGEHIRSA